MTKLPETGRASVVTSYGEPLEVREYPVTPPEPGALLVRIDRATICGTDVHVWEGKLASVYDLTLPLILGHEMVGRIVAFGDGPWVDSAGAELEIGDRVVWEHEACGRCYGCTIERNGSLCASRRIGFLVSSNAPPHFNGAFAEYAYVWPRSGRLRVPDEVTSEWASASSCALRTVINGWERLGVVDYRHSVILQGAGPLGLFGVAVAATHSARRIVVVGGPATRLEIAREWGADVTISIEEYPDPNERLELVKEATGGRGGDVVAELSGGNGAFAESIGFAAPNGRILTIGTVAGPDQAVRVHQIVHKNLTVYGSLSGEIDSYYKALQFMRMHRSQFDWDRMLGKPYGLDNLTEALERMRQFEEIKAVVAPGDDD